MREALKRIKKGKTAGPDETSVQVWKCQGQMAVEFSHKAVQHHLG